MRKKVVIAMCLAVTIASLLRLTLFYLVTAVLAASYIEITRELIHKNPVAGTLPLAFDPDY